MNNDWMHWWQGADWIVRGVFMVLLFLSILSWAVVFFKSWQLGRALRQTKRERHHLLEQPAREDAASVGHIEQTLRELRLHLEGGLTLLATIGATTPFLGLLGTVWGIIHALRQLGSSNAVSLDLVAGPVAEALIATAVGLFVAIPAVVAYNLLVRRLRVVLVLKQGNLLRMPLGGDHVLLPTK
ncbi:MAG: MotA/TolQ/ExbB proton channel family protein [Magnetococcales bacterium]|nr:MotA/TolQ/ExbB proton channel family protein [Magnetococcales bacterium]